MTPVFPRGPLDPMDQIVSDLILAASHIDTSVTHPMHPRLRREIEDVLRWAKVSGSTVYLSSLVASLTLWGSPEQRRELATMDPVVALVALASTPNTLLGRAIPDLPSPEEMSAFAGDPDTVAQSTRYLAEALSAGKNRHATIERDLCTTGDALLARVVGGSDHVHVVAACARCSDVVRVALGDRAYQGRSRVYVTNGSTWRVPFRNQLPHMIRVLIAAHTGVNPDVVEQMLEVEPS